MPTTDKKNVLKAAIEKVKMVNTGTKAKDLYGGLDVCSPKKADENRIIYPCLYLSAREAPVLSGLDVGATRRVVMDIKIIGKRLNARVGKEATENFDIEVRRVGLDGTGEKED